MRPNREPATNNRQTYMVTSSTCGRRQLFRTERWASLFINTLYHYRESAYLLHAFVLMPDHFHILLTPQMSLERTVQYPSDHRIRDAADYDVHVRYIHENPVRKHLCEAPADYPYSSAFSGFVLDSAPQRLKPLDGKAARGSAEAAPFQRFETVPFKDVSRAVSRHNQQQRHRQAPNSQLRTEN